MIISHRHRFVYVKTRKIASTSLEIALSNFHLYADEERPIVDHIGRYESLDESLVFIGNRLGLGEAITLPEQKTKLEFRRDRRYWRDVLSADDRLLLETICPRKIESFGYAW